MQFNIGNLGFVFFFFKLFSKGEQQTTEEKKINFYSTHKINIYCKVFLFLPP